jgi:ankyrin repeat protein
MRHISHVFYITILGVMCVTHSYYTVGMERAESNPEQDTRALDAVQSNRLEELTQALNKGASVNARDERGCSLAYYTAGLDHQDILAFLIGKGADIKQADRDGVTPLHIAAQMGWTGVMRMLIKHGADVNARDTIGATPLHYAALFGHHDAARLLLDTGACLRARDKLSREPLHYTLAKPFNYDIVKLLLTYELNKRARLFTSGKTL